MTTKGQMTVPKRVRTAVGLAEGDLVVFEVDGPRVTFQKVGAPQTEAEVETSLEEWDSPEDQDAWRDL